MLKWEMQQMFLMWYAFVTQYVKTCDRECIIIYVNQLEQAISHYYYATAYPLDGIVMVVRKIKWNPQLYILTPIFSWYFTVHIVLFTTARHNYHFWIVARSQTFFFVAHNSILSLQYAYAQSYFVVCKHVIKFIFNSFVPRLFSKHLIFQSACAVYIY